MVPPLTVFAMDPRLPAATGALTDSVPPVTVIDAVVITAGALVGLHTPSRAIVATVNETVRLRVVMPEGRRSAAPPGWRERIS